MKKKPTRASLKKEYVTKNTTLTKLHDKYGVPMRTLYKYSKADHWVDERKAFRQKIVVKEEAICAEDVELQVSTQAEFNCKLYHSADLLFDKINEILAMNLPLSPKDLKSISSTLLDLKMLRVTDINEDKDDKTIIEFVDMDWDEVNAETTVT